MTGVQTCALPIFYLSEHPNTVASALTTSMLVTDHYLTNQQAKKLADQKITVQDVLNEK